MQEHVMSEEMKLFFTKLLDLKKLVKNRMEMNHPNYEGGFLHEIYQRLDEIIKEKK